MVAPLVGAWIETIIGFKGHSLFNVAPLVGAWIETVMSTHCNVGWRVAPLVGAWIETPLVSGKSLHQSCRSPRGSVD